MSIWSILVSKRPPGPQQSPPFKCRKFFPFIDFENPMHFWPYLKSIFTYQNGLGSKKLFCKIFLKLNFTSKCIRARIPGANSHFLKNLNEPYVYTLLCLSIIHVFVTASTQVESDKVISWTTTHPTNHPNHHPNHPSHLNF
jgi:hypothetical protein